MREIGGYSVGRELHRTGLGIVYVASKGGGGETLAVKVCEPDVEVLGERAAGAEVREFLARAEVNKRIGENEECARGGRWAKVHFVGGTERGGLGAACVTDLGTIGTAESLVLGRVALDSAQLARVVGEVVEALRDLERGMGRGHGALKPSDVLICGDAEKGLMAARVVLTDAAVNAESAKDGQGTLADLRGIGELIHALVLHTKFSGGWPIENSPAWRALGSDGNAWRELVNVLLDPNPRAARPTLDELSAKIAPMRVVKKGKSRVLMGVAAAILLVGLVGGVAWHYTHREKITIVKWLEAPEKHGAEWKDLCEAYRGWYSLFQGGLGKAPTGGLRAAGYATRREAYAATDPQLKELLSLPGVAEGYDPWSIARVGRDVELGVLAATPTDYAKSDPGIEKTVAARAAVGALKKGLTEGWEAPKRLKAKADEWRGRGWAKPAMVLESAATGVNPEKAADPAEAVDSVLGLVPVVEKIDAAWAKVGEAGPEIAKSGDEVLGRFAGASASMVGTGLGDASGAVNKEDLATLEKQAGDVAGLAGSLKEFLGKSGVGGWAATDTESFMASEEYGKLRTRPPTAEAFGGWLALVKQHPALDPATDPRRGLDAVARIAGLEKDAAALTGVPLRGVMDAEVGRRIGKVKEDAGAIAPLQWKRTTEKRLTEESARLKTEMDDLKGRLEGLVAARRAEIAAKAAAVKSALSDGRGNIALDGDQQCVGWMESSRAQRLQRRKAAENLAREGIEEHRVFFVGNTMIDTLVRMEPRIAGSTVLDRLGLEAGSYILVTLHRPALVDGEGFDDVLAALSRLAEWAPVVFPVHPRTRRRIGADRLSPALHLTEPYGYIDFLALEANARGVLTDSGGVQEETTYLGIPCFTMRSNTERPVTVVEGTNRLLGVDPAAIADIPGLLAGPPAQRAAPAGWDGHAAERAAAVLVDALRSAPVVGAGGVR